MPTKPQNFVDICIHYSFLAVWPKPKKLSKAKPLSMGCLFLNFDFDFLLCLAVGFYFDFSGKAGPRSAGHRNNHLFVA